MAGISSNALKGLNYPENRKKYNGIEFTEDLDLDIYDAQLRNLDPQIGRWSQVDPKTEDMEMWSPYTSNYDNPIRYNDFLGDEPDDGGPGFIQGVKDGFTGYFGGIADAVTHPVETLKSGFSAQNIGLNVVDPLGVGRSTYNAVDNVRTVITEGTYGAGKVVGKTGAEVVVLATAEGAGRAAGAIRNIGKSTETINVSQSVSVSGPYQRPSNATTKAQWASVQGQPCVDWGQTSRKMVADHKKPLVQEHYETGKIDKVKMRSIDAVQPQCPTCSAKQGAEMSKYSKEQKKKHGF